MTSNITLHCYRFQANLNIVSIIIYIELITLLYGSGAGIVCINMKI